MAKSSTFRRFMTALKRHWKIALPGVTLITEPSGPLRRGMTFDAGMIPAWNQYVYLDIQTTWREAGHFTINLIIVDNGQEPSNITVLDHAKPGEKLVHGAHRIGNFVGDPNHDKWWHLCEVEGNSLGGEPDYWRELRLDLRKGNWTAPNYNDEDEVIKAAVADVTSDVRFALQAIGALAAGRA